MTGLSPSQSAAEIRNRDASAPFDDVVEVRATGRTPEVVTDEIRVLLAERNASGWRLSQVQPIIYNSSTTGYLLLFFTRVPAFPE